MISVLLVDTGRTALPSHITSITMGKPEVDLSEESGSERFMRKAKEAPVVPLGIKFQSKLAAIFLNLTVFHVKLSFGFL